jgi:hypothetical protein
VIGALGSGSDSAQQAQQQAEQDVQHVADTTK